MEVTIEVAKQWLLQYQSAARAVDVQLERLDALEARLEGPGSPQLDGMPRGTQTYDRFGQALARKEALENKIRGLIEAETKQRNEIEEYASRLRSPEEQAVLQMRYFDGERWSEINRMLFGAKEDFEDREASYLRRTTKLHGKALEHLAAILARDPPDDLPNGEPEIDDEARRPVGPAYRERSE